MYKITIEGSIMSMVSVGTKTSLDCNPGIVGKYPASRDSLIPIPQGVHEAEGYIFRDRIQTCRGTACNIKGSSNLPEVLQKGLEIEAGQTTRDGMFFLETVACLGVCAIAPVMTANGKLYGRLDTKREVRKSYKNEQVMSFYRTYLHEPGSQRAHELLHTRYGECRR